jgi:hypothetical protein
VKAILRATDETGTRRETTVELTASAMPGLGHGITYAGITGVVEFIHWRYGPAGWPEGCTITIEVVKTERLDTVAWKVLDVE